MDKQKDTENEKVLQFDGQQEDEEVIFTFRRHLIAMRKGFYALLIPFVIASIPALIWPAELNNLFIAIGGLVVGISLFFYFWIGWYFSVFIVTTHRLRQVSQRGFFGKSVIDLGISKIQNISYNVPGFSAAIFGFGTIVVQTYVGDLVLDKIEHPGRTYERLQSAIRNAASADSDNS
jgi:hypothetical protein